MILKFFIKILNKLARVIFFAQGHFFVCSPLYPSQCKLSWGDGIVSSNEKWDDGNIISGDGCSASWTVEDNYSCSGQSSVWKISIVASSTQSAVSSSFQGTIGVGNKIKRNF